MAKYLDSGAFQAALVRKQCGPANQRYTEGWNDCLLRVKSMVSKAPAADVAPVVHAQWIEDGSGIIICPECKRGYNLHAKYTHYCPNCGAKMDGGNENV
nr:MAG TPA: DNA-directed RNA polymerase subunit [Caudoviricetes sp.]